MNEGSARAQRLALGGFGLLLPLLGGGNVLFLLEPEPAIALLGLASLGTAGIWWHTGKEPPERLPFGATPCLLLFASVWLGSSLLRPTGPRAFLEMPGIFGAMVLFAALARNPAAPSGASGFAAGLLAGTLLTAVYGQYQYWIMFPRTAPLLQAMGGTPILSVNANFYNANAYGAFVAAVGVLSVGLWPHARPAARAALVAAWIALAATLILSGSRASAVLALVALIAVARKAPGIRRARLLVAALLGAVALLPMLHPSELWQVGLLGRVAIWRGSLSMIADHWLFGVGLGRYGAYFEHYRRSGYFTRYPHSFWLEVFAELGIAGAIGLGGFLVTAFARPLRCLQKEADLPLALRSIVASGAFLVVHGLLDIDWHAPANPLLLFALLGLAQGRSCAFRARQGLG